MINKITLENFGKLILPIILFTPFFTFGQVGIGTTNPQQKLHVSGVGETIRIDGLNQTNNPTKHNGTNTVPLHVNANGDLVLGQSPELALDINAGGSFMNPPIRIETDVNTSTHDTFNTGELSRVSFTVSKTSLVEVNASVAVKIYDENDDVLTDNISRMYGIAAYIKPIGGTETRLFEDATSYSNGPTSNGLLALSSPNYSVGFYNVGGNTFVELDAGDYEIILYGYVGGSYRPPTLGILFGKYFQAAVYFGGDFSFLKVVQHN
jgi:hypothetical protein